MRMEKKEIEIIMLQSVLPVLLFISILKWFINGKSLGQTVREDFFRVIGRIK